MQVTQVRLAIILTALFDGVEQAGMRTQTWTATNTPTGIYFCKVKAGGNVATAKVTLIK